ncbi:MAG: radical SAM protein [Thermoplasmatales archaeon]|nr:MAG: radical SAM protein [Thermoplasmatales archaeon]
MNTKNTWKKYRGELYQRYFSGNIIEVFVTDRIDSVRAKAELVLNNKIYIPTDIKLPYPIDRSTAGPSSGSLSIALTFINKNVKLVISQNQNEIYSLQKENGKFHILKDKKIFLENVEMMPILFHAPGQAFINLNNRCIYNCVFCNLSKRGFLHEYDEEKFIKLIFKASNRSDFHAVALTSGVYPDNVKTIKKMCNIIKNVKEKLPAIPIGVEPCISSRKEILLIKKAGADEIKINLQIPDKYLFDKICPDFHYNEIPNILREAVELFGKGKVTSNIIYGVGESDRSVIKAIEKLAKMGVVPTLRMIRINELNKKKLEEISSEKLPDISVNRILKIAHEQKKIIEKHGLTTQTFETMCHKCGCCDIVPFWDI